MTREAAFGYIYALHSGDGVVRYVGQTTRPLATRLREHKSHAKNGGMTPVKGWLIKHADCVQIDLIERCKVDLLNKREIHWINHYRNLLGDKLMNLEGGGVGASRLGKKHSIESLIKLSNSISGANHWNYGGHHSLDTKRKISESSMGRVPPNKGKQMSQIQRDALFSAGVHKIPSAESALILMAYDCGISSTNLARLYGVSTPAIRYHLRSARSKRGE